MHGLSENGALIAGCLAGWYARQLIYAIRQYKNVFWHFFYQISDEPEFYYSWINHGNMMFIRGHFTAAIGDYMQALDLRHDNFKALFNLSSAWIAKGRVDKSIEYIELARKADFYGQEEKANDIIAKRMDLINKFVSAKGNIKLRLEDIPVVA